MNSCSSDVSPFRVAHKFCRDFVEDHIDFHVSYTAGVLLFDRDLVFLLGFCVWYVWYKAGGQIPKPKLVTQSSMASRKLDYITVKLQELGFYRNPLVVIMELK
jgi:hypothetical protein